ncbi:MAG: GNAT family N-acetyltransferase [Oscillospiraceae bacterium]|nr:GNAT family N-acetyltransferase [Oscillospiraceae bacterium]
MDRVEKPSENGEEPRRLWFESVQGMVDGERVLAGSEAVFFPARHEVFVRFWGPEAAEPERYDVPPEITETGELLIWLARQDVSVPRGRLREALEKAGLSEERFLLTQEAKHMGFQLREASLTPALTKALIRLSAAWEAEGSCRGYRKNTAADIEGNRIFLLEKGSKILGYLFGHVEPSKNSSSVMPEGTPCFEVEELYVRPKLRSRGYGGMLFQYTEECVRKEAAYMMVSTATKDWQAILNFYLKEQGMQFWSARLFKKLD